MDDASSRRVQLRSITTGDDWRGLWAYLDESGNLHVDGQDLGPGTKIVSDDGEYEWFTTIKAEHLDQLISVLGGEPDAPILDLLEQRYTGTESYTFERLFAASGIPFERHVYP